MKKTVGFLFGIGALIALLGITGCSNPGSILPGYVQISLGKIGGPPQAPSGSQARTLVPGTVDASAFTSYVLKFTPSGGSAAEKTFPVPNLDAPVELTEGTWNLELEAYLGTEANKVLGATGTVLSIQVEATKTKLVTVDIRFKSYSGTGTFSYAITKPENITLDSAQISFVNLDGGAAPAPIILDSLTGAQLTGTQTGIPAGRYRVTVTLTGGEQTAIKFDEDTYIYGDQTTKLEGEDFSFEEDDFAALTVTGVIVKNAEGSTDDFTLPQGTVNYQFTPEVQGTNAASTGVTWAISPADHPGTTLTGDGRLTIAETETVNTEFIIRATSDADPTKSGSITVTVTNKDAQALPVPSDVTLSEQGAAVWTASSPETNVVKYSARLYKDGSPEGSAREVNQGETYSVDFLSAMRGGGPGSYTVKVKALGDGDEYSESLEAESAAQTVSQKTSVEYVWWFETSKARWVNVDGDSNYTVQLYKDDAALDAPVDVTRSGETDPRDNTKTVTTHDFSAAITPGGSYTFGVITKGDGALVLDSPETSVDTPYTYGEPLPAPAKPTLSSAGAVTWTPVTGASSYTVKLYKGGTAEETHTNQSPGASVLAGMRSKGAGTYTVKVIAVGDGTDWLDSPESPASDAQTVSVLGTPSGLAWSGSTATWTGVTTATGYTVKLYKGETLADTIDNPSSPLDLSAKLTSAGSYTFTVQAIASTTSLYLDSAVSAASAPKQIGGGVSIALTPLEGWTGTLGVQGGGSASIAKSNGSLTIEVTGSGFTSFVWIVDGAVVSGQTGSSITLSGSNYRLGGHSVTVYALDGNGLPWSPASPIAFTVTAE